MTHFQHVLSNLPLSPTKGMSSEPHPITNPLLFGGNVGGSTKIAEADKTKTFPFDLTLAQKSASQLSGLGYT